MKIEHTVIERHMTIGLKSIILNILMMVICYIISILPLTFRSMLKLNRGH